METTYAWSPRAARRARRAAGLTLADLAARLAAQIGADAPTTSTLHRWEQPGSAGPRSYQWPLIALALKCDVAALTSRAGGRRA